MTLRPFISGVSRESQSTCQMLQVTFSALELWYYVDVWARYSSQISFFASCSDHLFLHPDGDDIRVYQNLLIEGYRIDALAFRVVEISDTEFIASMDSTEEVSKNSCKEAFGIDEATGVSPT